VAAAVAVLVGLALAGRLDRIPLLDSAVADTLEALGAVALVGSGLLGRGRWFFRTVPLVVGLAAVLTGAIAVVLRTTGTVTDPYPLSFALWAGLALAAVIELPFALPGSDAVRRGLAGAAVPLTLAGAVLLVNDEYGVWPTFGDLLGRTGIVSASAMAPRAASLPARRGVLVAVDPPALRSHFRHRRGSVYLPAAYFTTARPDLPVIIMLAGTPGSPVQWPTAGAAVRTANSYAAAHQGRAPVLLFVDQNGSDTADTECVDGPQGNAETFLTVDVPAFVTQTLGIRRDPDRWAVAGFSEGGTCALDLVLAHPSLFRHLVDLGGDAQPSLGDPVHTLAALFGGSVSARDAHLPSRLLTGRRYPGVTAWFGAGVGDPSRIRIAQRLAATAGRADIDSRRLTVPGGHNWQFASVAFAQLMPTLCGQLGLA
jgi:S-formylglutathione hydrolase FrmB